MRRATIWTAALLVTAGLACAAASQETTPTSAPAESDAAAAGPATDAELEALVASNTAFALDLYRRLASAEGNVFLSPHSISTALAMTWAGAAGDTASEMAAALRFTLPPDRVHAAFQRLAGELASRSEGAEEGEEGDRFELTVANALWPQEGYTFLDAFMRVERDFYGAEPRPLSYTNDVEGARQTINGWVSEQTRERIPELLPSGSLTPDVRLVLTNAIYFKASWANAFNPEVTEPGPFHASGGAVTVPMMRQTMRAGWARQDGVVVLELPYLGNDVTLAVLMPEEGALADLESALTAERLGALLGDIRYAQIHVTIPRFESGSAMSLAEVLAALGMQSAFDASSADFSGMTGQRDLFISNVIHQANITLDETGTEAAAATAVIMMIRSSAVEAEPMSITIDRPFIYLIRDRATGAVVFLGRMTNPT